MAEYYKGTLLASPIVRGSSGDTYGTHHSVLGVGGYMEFKTLAERNALPPTFEQAVVDLNLSLNYDDISIGQRRLGMLAHVLETNEYYHLHPKTSGGTYITLADWNSYSYYQKVSGLTDNNNWYIVPIGDNDDIGERIEKEFYQSSNGFDLGDVIGYDGSEFIKVNATTASQIEPLGIVYTTGDTFTLVFAGHVNTVGIYDYSGNTLSASTVYYISPNFVGTGFTSYDGKLTHIPPTNYTDVSKPMLVTLGGTPYENKGVVLQYWGRSRTEEGVSLGDFLAYSAATQIHLDAAVTGATNIGFFSGKTGVQSIDMITSTSSYNGRYYSVYNNYYRDSEGIIRIGTPYYHGALRRGYVSNFSPKKSWLYNIYTGSTYGGIQVGWILVDGDITENIGNLLTANNVTANAGTPPFTEVEWSFTGGTGFDGYYSNSAIAFDVNGRLDTGNTYIFGGPVYSDKQYKELRLRTIVSDTPETLSVTFDDNFIYLSGITINTNITGATGGMNVGTGQYVYSGMTGTSLVFRSILGSGNTTVSTVDGNIIIYSSGGTGGGGIYDLDSPAVCTIGGVSAGYVLTGKTVTCIIKDMFVPVQYPVLTAPSVSTILNPSTSTYEVGATIVTLLVCSAYNPGCINPQYTATCDKRSCGVIGYCYTSTGGQVDGYYVDSGLTRIETVSSYIISAGTQTWGTCACHCAGVQPYDSKGNIYSTPLVAGFTVASSVSKTGLYPYYYGKLTSGSRPPVTNSLVTGGTKTVADSTGTVTVTFGSSASEYTWLAIPQASTSKTCWYVNALDNGCIGSDPGDKYPDECIIAITSGQGCWVGVNYKVYMSGTVGAISAPIQFRNS